MIQSLSYLEYITLLIPFFLLAIGYRKR